jgi:cytochrome c556
MKKFALALAATATLAALPAAAQFQKPEDAIKYRQSAFTVMANHFSRIGAMAQGRVPFDAATAASNAEIVAMMSRLPFAGFVDGSQGGKAKAEIWSDRDKFNAAAAKMQEEAGKAGGCRAFGQCRPGPRRPSGRRRAAARPATTTTARSKHERLLQAPGADERPGLRGAAASGVQAAEAKPSTTRRVIALFFSIFVTTTSPTCAVLATWVPPQG